MFAKKPHLPNSRLPACISEDFHVGANTLILLSNKLLLVLIVSKSLTPIPFLKGLSCYSGSLDPLSALKQAEDSFTSAFSSLTRLFRRCQVSQS